MKEKMTMRFGCCAPIQKYDEIAAAGYDYIEFPAWQVAELRDDEVRGLAAKIQRTGMPCPRLNSYCRGDPAIVGPRYDSAAVRAYAKKLMKNAAALRVECIGVGAPGARMLPEGYDPALADRQCEEFMRITAAEAAPYGIWLLLEAVQRNMCDYLNETARAKEIVERLDLENAALVVDLYNMKTQGESWDTLPDYLPLTRHIHVSTIGPGIARGQYGIEDADECDKTFAAIVKSGYDGTVSLEPDAARLNPDADKLALELMRKAAAKAG